MVTSGAMAKSPCRWHLCFSYQSEAAPIEYCKDSQAQPHPDPALSITSIPLPLPLAPNVA